MFNVAAALGARQVSLELSSDPPFFTQRLGRRVQGRCENILGALWSMKNTLAWSGMAKKLWINRNRVLVVKYNWNQQKATMTTRVNHMRGS